MEIDKKTKSKDAIIAISIVVGCMALVGFAFIAPKSKVQNVEIDTRTIVKPTNEDLQIFSYSSGLTGIYNKDTRILYVYDSSLKKCFLIRKIEKLGDDLIEIKQEKNEQ